MLLGAARRGAARLRVLAHRLLDALVGGLVVVLPDCDNARILGFPTADQPCAMSELHRQQLRTEELMEDGQVVGYGFIHAHAVEHLAS